MAITVKGKKLQKYRVTCTDGACCNVLEFDSGDVVNGTRYSMGRSCGAYIGIVCPDCKQILVRALFEEID